MSIPTIQTVRGRVVFFRTWREKISTLKPLTVWIFAVAISPPKTGNKEKNPATVFGRFIFNGETACFLILSDQDNTTRFVAATFFSLLFLRLVQYADMECPDRRLPVPVTLLLDEFCSIVGSINGFPQKLSNIRSRGIQVCIVFQQLRQLMNRFPDNLWSEILGNIDTIICLGCSSDPVTAKFISDRSGEVTIYADTVMRQRNIFTPSMLQPNYRHSEGTGRRKLLTPDEVMRLPPNKMLVMVNHEQLLELEKFDYTCNPESSQLKGGVNNTYKRRKRGPCLLHCPRKNLQTYSF